MSGVAEEIPNTGWAGTTLGYGSPDAEERLKILFEEGLERAANAVVPAYEMPGAWHERVRAGLTALLEFLDAQPVLARLYVAEASAARPAIERRTARAHEALVAAIDEGRSQSDVPGVLCQATAEGLVGVVFAVVYSRLHGSSPARLRELVNPLMNLIVLPFLGPEAARRELSRR